VELAIDSAEIEDHHIIKDAVSFFDVVQLGSLHSQHPIKVQDGHANSGTMSTLHAIGSRKEERKSLSFFYKYIFVYTTDTYVSLFFTQMPILSCMGSWEFVQSILCQNM
jgi:hypothetical protein